MRVAGCPHPSKRTLYTARDYITGGEFEVVECERCGLGMTDPQPHGDALAAYYPETYYGAPTERRFVGPVEALQRLLYAGRACAVERLAGGTGNVLDVGCGRGLLLDAFRRRGWKVQGTELSEQSSAYAREVRIPVHLGPPESWPWPEASLDAVVLWHVLEHWPDPLVPLRRAAALLRPGGVLMIGVPNMESLEARLARDKWFHLDVPRHLVHLGPRWLTDQGSALGFELRETSYLAPEYDAFSFVQSALNRFGFRQNLLYDLLRSRSAKVLRGKPGRLEFLAMIAFALPLAALSLPATISVSLAGAGSSVTTFFTKSHG